MSYHGSLPLHLLAAMALFGAAACGGPPVVPAPAPADPGERDTVTIRADDPRVDLGTGWRDPGTARLNMELLASRPRPEGFVDPGSPGNILFANSDMAYRGDVLFLGNFRGFQIWDIANPSEPVLRTAVLCPGGQGDVSVYGDLLFMSVEMPNGRVDCGTGGTMEPGPDPERFRGVRVFDISDLDSPRQVAAVQTCRGSHTHTLVPDARDDSRVYVYSSGTADVRPATELEGCVAVEPAADTATAYFRIEVIEVPLAAPEEAAIVNMPRIFATDEELAGLWPGGAHGEGTQTTARTDQCHDITSYPALGLAAGACSGNGILLDIAAPDEPVRIDEVVDPNFAYWHSATVGNDGRTVIFTDEWGGGLAARCQATDRREWGANAIFSLEEGELRHRGYYKLPVPQGPEENCVAHNGSLVPVPGRDIMVQAWYQGGISVFDFTDPEAPYEIAYFDRGPVADELVLGGFWSAYWYNGLIYGSEIARGLDVFRLTPSEHLSRNEIEAARLVRWDRFNPQTQPEIVWPADIVVARAYLDQIRRGTSVAPDRLDEVAAGLDRADSLNGTDRRTALTRLATTVDELPRGTTDTVEAADTRRLEALARTLRELAGADG